jgi:hypothetical protein
VGSKKTLPTLQGMVLSLNVTNKTVRDDYYDVNLKKARLRQLAGQAHFRFIQLDLADRAGMAELFAR